MKKVIAVAFVLFALAMTFEKQASAELEIKRLPSVSVDRFTRRGCAIKTCTP